MKQFLLTVCMICFVGMAGLNAQCAKSTSSTGKAGKSCCASKSTSMTKGSNDALAKAASLDSSIESIKDHDGNVSYQRKSVCPMSGKVSYSNVQFDAASAKFVDQPTVKGKACVGESAKSCSKGSKDSKACCASKSKGAQTSVIKENESNTKM